MNKQIEIIKAYKKTKLQYLHYPSENMVMPIVTEIQGNWKDCITKFKEKIANATGLDILQVNSFEIKQVPH